jgi:hypothetical protein
MTNNANAALHGRPNRLLDFEIEPLSEGSTIAVLDLAPELGEPGRVLINLEIAKLMRAKLDAFILQAAPLTPHAH